MKDTIISLLKHNMVTKEEHLDKLAEHPNSKIRMMVAQSPHCTHNVLNKLAQDSNHQIAKAAEQRKANV